jgi:hypothetical protein
MLCGGPAELNLLQSQFCVLILALDYLDLLIRW